MTKMLRWATTPDYDMLGQLMFAAIHAEPSPYTTAERRAWRASPYQGPDWHERLASQHVLVAENETRPVGFMTLTPQGYVDLAYLLADARGQGWFRKLACEIERKATQLGLDRLHTHASLSAEGPFKAMGYTVSERETVALNGQRLKRAAMEKRL